MSDRPSERGGDRAGDRPNGEGGGGPTAFVIGHPIAHSRSPVIHRHWLRERGARGDYRAVDVAPDALGAWLDALDPETTPGGNVTMPHKEAVARWLGPARLDATARAVGAVNTLWREGGEWRGGSTDGEGLLADLDARAPEWRRGGRALVIGAGGAARSIVHALRGAGLAVTVANRTLARAQELAAEFGARAAPLAEAAGLVRDADLVVNTAAPGAGASGAPHVDPALYRPGQIAYDIVYAPLDTPFLVAARGGGAKGLDGLGMLLHQAVPGFERWFGTRPTVTATLREAVERTL